MNIVKIVFSFDRPLQLWGVVRSILDNTDLSPDQIVAICRSSDRHYRQAYQTVGNELKCHIQHENRVLSGINLRLLNRAIPMRKARMAVLKALNLFIVPIPLGKLLKNVIHDRTYVSLAVDDMCYFRKSSFTQACQLFNANQEVGIWSWRIGVVSPPPDILEQQENHWLIDHRIADYPYGYIFHTDGSIFRTSDLIYWLDNVPSSRQLTLNQIESHIAAFNDANRDRLRIGSLHAGPLHQTCITWQVNKVTFSTGGNYSQTALTEPGYLLEQFKVGKRLDYSPLYGRTDWLTKFGHKRSTHMPPTPDAAKFWNDLIVG